MSKRSQGENNTLFNYIQKQTNHLPISNKVKAKMLAKLSELKEITLEAREPRIALVGRRGSGKSSLINALFGMRKQFVSPVKAGTKKGKWFWYPNDEDRKMRLLDTRGLGESETPAGANKDMTPLDELKETFTEEPPDVFLFLVKAKETDARVEEDLHALKKLRDFVTNKYRYAVPVICAVTQADELDPPHYLQLPLDGNEWKAKNIQTAMNLMKKRFAENKIPLLKIIPISTYVDFDDNGNIIFDLRWNVDKLAIYLVDSLPNEAKLKTAKLMKMESVKKKVAQKIVGIIASIAGLLGFQPIPLADLPFLTALQCFMIVMIAFIAGKEISTKTAAEFISALGINLGLAFVARESVRSIVKFIPAAGNVISGAVAGAVTYGIGHAGITYFIEGSDIEKAKKVYKQKKKKHM